MATISSAPFPITISQNSVVGIRLDFNVNSSVQSDLSMNPVVTIKHLIQRQDDEDEQEMENVDEIDGQVTVVGSNQFTLMNEKSGQSFVISVDSNTAFEDFDRTGCTASPAVFSCAKFGQILDADFSENAMGKMLAKRVEFEEAANGEPLKDPLHRVPSSTHFHMAAFNDEPPLHGL